VLIVAFVSLVFQKSTENEHWGHRLKWWVLLSVWAALMKILLSVPGALIQILLSVHQSK